ncbi:MULTISPECIES: cytochrome P450 [unclassified Streptomyces]|uniref:cytochrome P450 n=1 Tax=unclassified Streptomyces TaxID=2593676 RepID=UPI003805DA36
MTIEAIRPPAPLPATVPDAPGALPLVGHIPQMARSPLEFFKKLAALGPVVRIRIGAKPAYVVSSPELVHRLHVSELDSFDKGGPLFEKVRHYVGNGLASCPAHDHARQRPALQPAFQRSRIERYAEVMTQAAAEVTDSWKAGEEVDLYQQMHRLTTLVISRTLISAEVAGPAAASIAESVPDIMSGVYWRMVIPGRFFPKLPIPVNRRYEEVDARVRKVVNDVVDTYRADGIDHGDLMSMVVAACENEPDPHKAVYDQVVTFLTAGLESVASSLVYTLRLLDQHPEITARVLAEIEEALGDGADGTDGELRLPGYQDMNKLRFTQNVLTEGLRLFPPAWIVSRVATTDVTWEEGHIPEGAGVFFSPYIAHRDPEIFPDPEAFDPDRWGPDRVTTAQRQAYFSLGAGRRKCIGDVYGTVESTIALATVLSRWKLHHRPGSENDKPSVTALLIPPRTLVRVEKAERSS